MKGFIQTQVSGRYNYKHRVLRDSYGWWAVKLPITVGMNLSSMKSLTFPNNRRWVAYSTYANTIIWEEIKLLEGVPPPPSWCWYTRDY